MNRLTVMSCVCFSFSSAAQILMWTDKDGVTHYTDNRAAVPADAKVETTTGTDISFVQADGAKSKGKVEVSKQGVGSVSTVASDERKLEREWRGAFREANERVLKLADEIELDRKKVEEVNGLPVAARFHCFNVGVLPWLGVPVVSAPLAGASAGVAHSAGSVSVTGAVAFQNQTFWSGALQQPCFFGLNAEFERAKERLELNRKALQRAKEDLAELERRASLESVPREWRR
jgi:hypothetical protein